MCNAGVFEEVPQQKGNIGGVFADWRHAKLNHIQAVIEVLAELALGDLRRRSRLVAVINRTFARCTRPIGADRLNISRFGEPQQHRLHPKTHLAEFVQKQRATFGLVNQSGLVTVRAGEAAAYMAEQL